MADTNPIKYSDLVVEDNSIANLISELQKLDKTYDATASSLKTIAANASKVFDGISLKNVENQLEQLDERIESTFERLRKEAANIQKVINSVSGATAPGRETIKKAITDAEALAAANKKLEDSQKATALELARVKKAQAEVNQINKLNAKLAESAAGSYDKLSAQYSLNKIALNGMSAEMRENTEAGKALVAETAAIYEEMKRLQAETGKMQLNVGNYAESMQAATGWTANFGEQLRSAPGAVGNVSNAVDGLGKSFVALLKNPIVLTIAAIVAGLTLLFNAFKKSETGAGLLSKAAAMLQGGLSVLTKIAESIGKVLLSAFNDPVGAIKGLWDAIRTNLVNRVKGVIELFTGLGGVIKNTLKGDFEAAGAAAREAGKSLATFITGLDTKQMYAFGNAVKSVTNDVLAQTMAFAKLSVAQKAMRKSNRELGVSLEQLSGEVEKWQIIADDQTRSFAEREAAANKAVAATKRRAAVERQIAQQTLSTLQQEISVRRASGEQVEDLLDQEAEARKALIAANNNLMKADLENTKRQNELKQDWLEQDLDILIDYFDNVKTINEQIINDETRSFDERRAVLEETALLGTESFNKQIETIKQFTNIYFDEIALLNEADAVRQNENVKALGLSEAIGKRMLEILRERRTALSDFAQLEVELGMQQTEAAIKARKTQKETDEKAIKDAKEKQKALYDLAVSEIDARAEIEALQIDALNASEKKKTDLRLKAERDRINKILFLNKMGGNQLTALQKEMFEAQLALINKQIGDNGKENRDIWDLLGLNISDKKKEAINTSMSFAKDQLLALADARIAAADRARDVADTEVEAARDALRAEMDARAQGYANNVVMAQKELDAAKKNQQKAIDEQRKAQKAQQAIQSLEQAGSLVTASAKIWGTLGFPWAIPAIAVMFGSFAYSKLRAKQMSKTEQYGDGTVELLTGGSHQSGNDIDLGTKPDGTKRRAEGGEFFAVINKSSSRKYAAVIPDVIKSLNAGTFEQRFGRSFEGSGLAVVNNTSNVDLSDITKSVNAIRDKESTFVNQNGDLVVKYKNVTRIIKK